MKQTWKIAKWELLRNIRNKQFLISLLLTPIIMVVFAGAPALIQKVDKPQEEIYYVQDQINQFAQLEKAAEDSPVRFVRYEGDSGQLAELVIEEEADGYFVLNETFVQTGQVVVNTKEKRVTLNNLEQVLNEFLQELRIQQIGITKEQISFLTAPAILVPEQIGAESSSGPPGQRKFVALVLAGLLMFLIFSSGTMLLHSALQEKQDRMAEIVLSSVNSDNLMQGKIIGHFLLGLLQLSFWLIIGLPLARFFLDIPLLDMISFEQIPAFFFFALLGYLLYAALFVGVGATMSDMQSATNTQGIVFMLPLSAVIFAGPVIGNPYGMAAKIGTFLPVTSPCIVILRMGLAEVPLWELLVAGFVLVISAWLVVKASAKLFRIGMLMYGKSATPQEMWKWLRY